MRIMLGKNVEAFGNGWENCGAQAPVAPSVSTRYLHGKLWSFRLMGYMNAPPHETCKVFTIIGQIPFRLSEKV